MRTYKCIYTYTYYTHRYTNTYTYTKTKYAYDTHAFKYTFLHSNKRTYK